MFLNININMKGICKINVYNSVLSSFIGHTSSNRSAYVGYHLRAKAAPLLSGHASVKGAVLLVRIVRTLQF